MLPTITFEIKPKSCDRFTSSKLCQFCSFQYYKLGKGKIDKFSEYCPALIFSNNETKVIQAIKYLYDNPQNNLSYFVNGEKVLIYNIR